MTRSKPTRIKRRSFLGLGMATVATVAVAPTLWLPRTGHAQTSAFGAAKHLVVVNLDGGMRSTCLFNADVSEQWNPPEISGKQAGADGTEWGVGGVFPATDYPDTGGVLGGVVPAVPKITSDLCVLGTVDHTPGEDRGDGNHDSARIRMATGAANGTRGLATIIYRDHALYQGGGRDTNLPPVVIGNSARLWGSGAGEFGPYRPVIVGSWRDFRNQGGSDAATQPGWATQVGAALDDDLAVSRAARHRAMVDGLRDSKRQAATFRPVFTDPLLDVEQQPDATAHGMSNAQLLAAFGSEERFGLDAALAMRFLGFGAPAVVLGDGGWDFHSDERTEFRAHAENFARVLAGLHYALRTLQHPDGGTYWDHTLVVVTSEFGRDNTEVTGFNSGEGSDHNGGPASRYQALPFMGGLVGQGGRFFGATDAATMEPRAGEPVFSSTSILATCLDVLGIDPTPHFPDAPMDVIF